MPILCVHSYDCVKKGRIAISYVLVYESLLLIEYFSQVYPAK